MQTERYLLHVLFVPGDRVASPSISAGNPLLLNSSMQPDLTVGRAYSTPLCFRDGADKDLFDPLPDIKMKVQSSFMVSLGVSERAEFHAKGPAETFPRDLSRDYGGTADRRKKGLLTLKGGCNRVLHLTNRLVGAKSHTTNLWPSLSRLSRRVNM